jgi:hypothetical protein
VSVPVVFQDDADIEVEEAALWYEEQRPGLGLEYMAAVSRVILDIGVNPERFLVWRLPWRRPLLRRFPCLKGSSRSISTTTCRRRLVA